MSNFLDNLKNDLESGEFNSDAAKKINSIDSKADNMIGGKPEKNVEELKKKIIERQAKNSETPPMTKEEVLKFKLEHDEKMLELKKIDIVNTQLATIIDIEDMVIASVGDMFEYVGQLYSKFEKEFSEDEPMYSKLKEKIEEVKTKYESIFNPSVSNTVLKTVIDLNKVQ